MGYRQRGPVSPEVCGATPKVAHVKMQHLPRLKLAVAILLPLGIVIFAGCRDPAGSDECVRWQTDLIKWSDLNGPASALSTLEDERPSGCPIPNLPPGPRVTSESQPSTDPCTALGGEHSVGGCKLPVPPAEDGSCPDGYLWVAGVCKP
jgi:hypothetical protein